jgi:ABC-type branched-subunit amino acid transport system substrate-binding protein
MRRLRFTLIAAVVLAVLAAATLGATPASATANVVTIPRGQPVQLAAVLDLTGTVGSQFGPGILNAIEFAVEQHPAVRGFPIQVNDGYDVPCASSTVDVVTANLQAAQDVVANGQNVAVIGHMCSFAFSNGCAASGTALATYQQAGIVAINGSATAGCLPSVGTTVFDRTAIPDDLSTSFDAWYGLIQATPRNMQWQLAYMNRFGVPPTAFADLYYDATSILIAAIQSASYLSDHALVVDRAALAQAVRHTVNYQGVTCATTIDPATGNRVLDLAAIARCD